MGEAYVGACCVCVWRRTRRAAREGKKNGFMARRWGSGPEAAGHGLSRRLGDTGCRLDGFAAAPPTALPAGQDKIASTKVPCGDLALRWLKRHLAVRSLSARSLSALTPPTWPAWVASRPELVAFTASHLTYPGFDHQNLACEGSTRYLCWERKWCIVYCHTDTPADYAQLGTVVRM